MPTPYLTKRLNFYEAFYLSETLKIIERPDINQLISKEDRAKGLTGITNLTGNMLVGAALTIAKLSAGCIEFAQRQEKIRETILAEDPNSDKTIKEIESLRQSMDGAKPDLKKKIEAQIKQLEDSLADFIKKVEDEILKIGNETIKDYDIYQLDKADLAFAVNRDYYPNIFLVTKYMYTLEQ